MHTRRSCSVRNAVKAGKEEEMISELLDINQIELDVEAEDWREALRMAGKVLVQSGKIQQEYVEATIRAVEEMGPYIVIMPGVAFGHSRPDASVKEDCMQIIRLKTPVNFGSIQNDPVKLVILFATTDSNGHLLALQRLAELMSEPSNVKLLMESDRVEEIQGLLANY